MCIRDRWYAIAHCLVAVYNLVNCAMVSVVSRHTYQRSIAMCESSKDMSGWRRNGRIAGIRCNFVCSKQRLEGSSSCNVVSDKPTLSIPPSIIDFKITMYSEMFNLKTISVGESSHFFGLGLCDEVANWEKKSQFSLSHPCRKYESKWKIFSTSCVRALTVSND